MEHVIGIPYAICFGNPDTISRSRRWYCLHPSYRTISYRHTNHACHGSFYLYFVWNTALSHLPSILKIVVTTFWSLGLVAFGGPQAHIAILRDHLVIRRNWIQETEFMELFAIGQVGWFVLLLSWIAFLPFITCWNILIVTRVSCITHYKYDTFLGATWTAQYEIGSIVCTISCWTIGWVNGTVTLEHAWISGSDSEWYSDRSLCGSRQSTLVFDRSTPRRDCTRLYRILQLCFEIGPIGHSVGVADLLGRDFNQQ